MGGAQWLACEHALLENYFVCGCGVHEASAAHDHCTHNIMRSTRVYIERLVTFGLPIYIVVERGWKEMQKMMPKLH